jgi:endonuclease G, mitochondrial
MLTALAAGCSFFYLGPGNTSPDKTAQSKPGDDVASDALSVFGNPSEASGDKNNFLIEGLGSAFSYNNYRGTVNWIAWKTTRADLGAPAERPDFQPDQRLPAGFKRIKPSDYSASGYDRGHLVPAADRFANADLLAETFLMTNIVPQTSSLNRYPWEQLESYVRGQVRRGWDAYQIAGVYGEQRKLKNRVMAPTNCWKIVAFVRSGRFAQVDSRTRIIAVDMPNREAMEDENWRRYVTNIRVIETKTGYNFFAALAADLQETIETRQEFVLRKPT